MDEYIDKNALYKKIAELEEVARNRYLNAPKNSPVCSRFMEQLDERTRFKQMVEDFPPVDVAPVKHGKWERDHTDMKDRNFDVVRCSTCGYKAYAISVHIRNGNYCPVCGAKMDLEEQA